MKDYYMQKESENALMFAFSLWNLIKGSLDSRLNPWGSLPSSKDVHERDWANYERKR